MESLSIVDNKDLYGKDKLDIFKIYGIKASTTDYAILLGASPSYKHFTIEGDHLKNRSCPYWTKTPNGNGSAIYISGNGIEMLDSNMNDQSIGFRLKMTYSDIMGLDLPININNYGIKEINYGYLPGKITDDYISKELEKLRIAKKLNLLKREESYKSNSLMGYEDKIIVICDKRYVYEFQGEKFIPFKADKRGVDEILSDGTVVEENDIYWLKVEPIVWLFDEKTNTLVTKKVVIGGFPFNSENNYDGNFNNTDYGLYSSIYLRNEIFNNDIKNSYVRKRI